VKPDLVVAMNAELKLIDLWDAEYLASASHQPYETQAYENRQMRRKEIKLQLARRRHRQRPVDSSS